jgi:hypothetical protein
MAAQALKVRIAPLGHANRPVATDTHVLAGLGRALTQEPQSCEGVLVHPRRHRLLAIQHPAVARRMNTDLCRQLVARPLLAGDLGAEIIDGGCAHDLPLSTARLCGALSIRTSACYSIRQNDPSICGAHESQPLGVRGDEQPVTRLWGGTTSSRMLQRAEGPRPPRLHGRCCALDAHCQRQRELHREDSTTRGPVGRPQASPVSLSDAR